MSQSSSTRRLPAEWETQSGVMLTWPHESGDWAALLAKVEPVFFSIAMEIAQRETLLINCATSLQGERVRSTLLRSGVPESNVLTAVIPSNDTWARDHGAITVLDGDQPRLLDFQFNGWGNKYAAKADNAITGRLIQAGWFGTTAHESVDLVLEGGSIESDGCGTLLTTRCCLLHPQRNPQHSRRQLQHQLLELLGLERMLWLEHGGLEGDDTDGHIDMLARFCNPATIAYQSCDDLNYAWYDELKAMESELQQLRTAGGEPYRLIALPWPEAKLSSEGSRLPASYANFLVINGAVLVPGYDDAADDEAARCLQACFPDREIVQIPCLPLIQQFGSLHCLTMQFPEGVEFQAVTAG